MRLGVTPSASASAVPRGAVMVTSMSSASSHVAKALERISASSVRSERLTTPSGTWTSGRGRPAARRTSSTIAS